MRFALCNEVLRDKSWAEACRLMKDAGYDGIELAPFTFAHSVQQLSKHERADIRDTARQHGLEIIGLHWLLVSPEGLHATHPGHEVRKRTADYLCELVRFCYEVGGHLMVFGSPKQRSTVPPVTPEQAIHFLPETLQPALELCAGYGITMMLEPLPVSETDVVNTLAEAVQLVKQAGHPHLRTIFDVKSALSETEDLLALLDEYYPFISHVHLNDSNRRAPGYGTTDFALLLQALQAKGYEGWCSVEPFDYFPDPETLIYDTLRYLEKGLVRHSW